MTTSSRFTVALHILTLLAHAGEEALTSEYVAGSVNTHPVVIRRLLALLRTARLVTSQGGTGGGWRLARAARGITLRDVYRAVEGGALFAPHAAEPNARCPVGGHIQEALSSRFRTAEVALEDDLARSTVADLLQDVRARTPRGAARR